MMRRLQTLLGASALLAGVALSCAGGVALWRARTQDARLAALAQGRGLIARGNLEAAQALADAMQADDVAGSRSELLYALGNAELRRGLALIRIVPYRKAAPVLRQARAAYREALRLDPENWDARYNYAVVAPLLRDTEAAQPTVGDAMAHQRAAWPDIPGAPNGMP